MPHRRLIVAAVLCACLLGTMLVSGAGAALVAVNGLVLRADGSYHPNQLPRKHFAPIEFRGHFSIAAAGGGRPALLQQAVIEFDRDGHLDVTGLAHCQPEQVIAASTAQARRICASSIVGTGTVGAMISTGFGAISGSAPLTIFNGPQVGGNPTAILHARLTFPSVETYAIVVPIERQPGPFRYRATINLPPIAGGLGTITGVEAEIGRRFRFGGRERSYVSARCSDGILETHGRFTFADGTIIDGSVEKFCRVG
jgi:hypothetical protein